MTSPAPASAAQRVLLLVDDEPNILTALTRLLRRDGYRILTAGSGEQGLAIMAAEPAVGVIVSDQRMPSMIGTEFLARVRDRWPDPVRLVLSGYTDLKSVTDAVNRGAVYKFLTKPWDDHELRGAVLESFERFELRRENRQLTDSLEKANAELTRLNGELERRAQARGRELFLSTQVLHVVQAILDRLPVAVLGVDSDGVIAAANAAMRELVHAPQGLVGQEVATLPQALRGVLESCGPLDAADVHVDVGRGRVHAQCSPFGLGAGAPGRLLVCMEERA